MVHFTVPMLRRLNPSCLRDNELFGVPSLHHIWHLFRTEMHDYDSYSPLLRKQSVTLLIFE